jgi:hypothetical protein
MKTDQYLIAAVPPSIGQDCPGSRFYTTQPGQPVNSQSNLEKAKATGFLLARAKTQ